jgi:DNA-binding CsgD family transcriptional regulator
VVAVALEDALPAEQPGRAMADGHAADELSERDLEVARLVASGLSNPAIAGGLFVSVATVKTHFSHILSKLGLQSRVQLANWVTAHGLQRADAGRAVAVWVRDDSASGRAPSGLLRGYYRFAGVRMAGAR